MTNEGNSAIPDFSIVVPVRDRSDLLRRAIASILDSNIGGLNGEIIVCDDGSSENIAGELENLVRPQIEIRYVRQSAKGPAAARNLGISHSSADIIIFFDSDVIVSDSAVLELYNYLQRHPKYLGVEACLKPSEGSIGPLSDAPISEHGGGYHTAGIAYKKTVLYEVGGFDEYFPYAACEDVELACRVLRLGEIAFCHDAIVEHPVRRVNLKTHLKWARQWRYITILAVRYGVFGFPGKQVGPLPRLQVAVSAAFKVPTARLFSSLKSLRLGEDDALKAMLYALFDYPIGLVAAVRLMLQDIPNRKSYFDMSKKLEVP
jgi:glycosyltransferase involved in cell wall biosynthesis